MNSLLPPAEKMQYRAVGFVRGTYTPLSADCFGKGHLKTPDGVTFPCLLTKISANFFQKHPEKLEQELVFNAWVRTQKDGALRFQIKSSICPVKFASAVDSFSIRGTIQKILDNVIVIRVRRNKPPPEGKENTWQYKPFVVILAVSPTSPLLNKKYLGQFWEFQVCRSEGASNLIVEDCKFIAEAPRKKYKPHPSSPKPKPIVKKNKVAI